MKNDYIFTVKLNGTQLSDLFFNHQNLNYEEVVTHKDIVEALMQDAKEFCQMLGMDDEQINRWSIDLVNDFMERL